MARQGRGDAETIELIIQSAALVGGFIGYVDLAEGEPYWLPPQGGRRLWELREERLPSTVFDAQRGMSAMHPLSHRAREGGDVGELRVLPLDFIERGRLRRRLADGPLERRLDIVPVIICGPDVGAEFPDVNGMVVPMRDPASGRKVDVRMTKREVARRRAANEERLASVVDEFEALGLDPHTSPR